MLLLVGVLFLTTVLARTPESRAPKQLFTRLDNLDFSSNYKFCRHEDNVLPCLHPAECKREDGTFLSYCGSSDSQCCKIIKNCGQETYSHSVTFRNAKYPKNETTQSACSLKQHIRNGICAVRVNFESFVTTKPHKDFCPGDNLLILGTGTKVAHLCGDLTNYSTTFDVKESSSIDYIFTLQGYPAYKFSLEIIGIPCNDITRLTSSPLAGIRNKTAVRYEPPTPKPLVPVTTENPGTEATPSSDVEETTTIPETVKEETTDTSKEEEKPKNGTEENVNSKLFVVDSIDRSPPNSYFKQIYDELAGPDQCSQNEAISSRSDPLISGKFEDSRCWAYDPSTGSYSYTKDCEEIETDQQTLEDPTFRIIDGSYTNINEYPWQVALLYNKSFVCGGALISDRYVLTAAHCVNGGFKKGLQHFRVSLGDHDLSTLNETKSTIRYVKRVIPHLHYFPLTITHDIALLELMEPVEFSYAISPVKLPTDLSETYANATVTITGWGRYTRKSRRTSKVLKEFTSHISDITECVDKWKKVPKISAFRDMHICLNISKGTPCHGDSGGPLVACNGDHCTVIGVVSFAFPLCKDVGLPAVFTRVTHFKEWIDMNTSPIHTYDNDKF